MLAGRPKPRLDIRPVGRNSETYSAVFSIILYAVNASAPCAPSPALRAVLPRYASTFALRASVDRSLRRGGLPFRWHRRELRTAHAQPSARVLPQLFRRVQMADRAGDGAEIVAREFFGDIGEVERLLADDC